MEPKNQSLNFSIDSPIVILTSTRSNRIDILSVSPPPMLRPNLQRRKPHNRHCYHRRNRHTNHHRNQEHQLGSDQVPAALAKAACDSGGPKGGTPHVRQDGGHHRWPGPGGILWTFLTLPRGVPKATGIRTAALAKDCKRSTGAL